ncbi:hypothetical protein [Mycolicibacterium bacteremicum]|uniref:hypothetical protein n=1 Tax=Mycolicibacterium bacteremicum TaxID=564198 RepID=UPI0026EA94D5|nr:hypothetical protein [Mycolicibacterium bacteremicum]
MLSDPAAAAWVAAGRPSVNAPAPIDGRCGRCGQDGLTVTSSHIISEKFTGFDAWPFGSRRLCVPCAWAYTRQPTTQPSLLITATAVTEYSVAAGLAEVLTAGPLSTSQAVVLPTARRRHILPTAEWGRLATDGLVVAWDHISAALLADLAWLRATVGATWPQLHRAAPPTRVLRVQPADTWVRILTAWEALHAWRTVPPLWAAARLLTNPPERPSSPRSAD